LAQRGPRHGLAGGGARPPLRGPLGAGGPVLVFGIRAGVDDLLIGTINAQLGLVVPALHQADIARACTASSGRGFATPASAAVAVRAGFRFMGHHEEADEVGKDWYVRELSPCSGTAEYGQVRLMPRVHSGRRAR
jgi:hypothetical protein